VDAAVDRAIICLGKYVRKKVLQAWEDEMSNVRSQAIKNLFVQSIYSRLDTDEQLLRREILNQIIQKNIPIDVCQAAKVIGMSLNRAEEVKLALQVKKAIVLNTQGRVKFSYPVSALPTCHQVTLADGRKFHAMCAIDAIGSSFTFGGDVIVESKCYTCGKPIKVIVQAKKEIISDPQGIYVLHVDLNKYENWAVDT